MQRDELLKRLIQLDSEGVEVKLRQEVFTKAHWLKGYNVDDTFRLVLDNEKVVLYSLKRVRLFSTGQFNVIVHLIR